jgi:hypothetical protein
VIVDHADIYTISRVTGVSPRKTAQTELVPQHVCEPAMKLNVSPSNPEALYVRINFQHKVVEKIICLEHEGVGAEQAIPRLRFSVNDN